MQKGDIDNMAEDELYWYVNRLQQQHADETKAHEAQLAASKAATRRLRS